MFHALRFLQHRKAPRDRIKRSRGAMLCIFLNRFGRFLRFLFAAEISSQ